MKTNPQAYHAFEQLLLTAEQASTIEDYLLNIAAEDDTDCVPPWMQKSDDLAALLRAATKAAGLLARTMLAYAEEHIRLYRYNEERPAPDRRSPRNGDTPSSN